MNPTDSESQSPSLEGQRPGFLRRHRVALIWLAVLAAIVVIRWPMVKGTFYRIANVPAPADGIAWQADLAAAMAASRQAGKPVLLDFTASWCPPCQVMKHEVWPDAQVRDAVAAGYVPVMADIDTPPGREAAERYAVESIPTILVVDADGKVLRRRGYLSKAEMLGFLRAGG